MYVMYVCNVCMYVCMYVHMQFLDQLQEEYKCMYVSTRIESM